MIFTTAKLSNAGGREVNQDACDYWASPQGVRCWILADGLGGHGGGEVASRLAVENVLETFKQNPVRSAEVLQRCVEAAQASILEKQPTDPRLAAMRTTLVLVIADSQYVQWIHIGDSRLYLLRNGEIYFQTDDHSVPQAMVAAGDIAASEMRYHEDRNRLLRSLGTDEVRPTIEPSPKPIQPNDAFLLCTDGFWEYVLETEMEIDFAKSETPQAWLAYMHGRLLQRAEEGNDNYSAVGVFVHP